MENTITENQKIAQIIYRQIGAKRFEMMTGSKNFLAIENGLQFKVLRNKGKSNLLEIKLNGLDLYDMKFIKVKGGKLNKNLEYIPLTIETVKEYNNVYNDMLQEIFTSETGFYTRLF